MSRDAVISDELWAVLEPVMPQDQGRPSRPWNDHRTTLEGIVWRFRTGVPWRDVPRSFGAYQSVWQRHRLWSTDGTYEAMFAAVREQAGVEPGDAEVILSIDSTIIRAHQHAAGARHDSVAEPGADATGGRVESQDFCCGVR